MLPSSKSGRCWTAPEKIQWCRLRTALSLPGLRTTLSNSLSFRRPVCGPVPGSAGLPACGALDPAGEKPHHGPVGFRERRFVERRRFHPADGVVVREFEIPFDREDSIGQELDGQPLTAVNNGAEDLPRPRLEAQLLGQLALQAP